MSRRPQQRLRIGVFITGGIDAAFEHSRVPVLAAYLRALSVRAQLHIFALDDRPDLGTHDWFGATVQHLSGHVGRRGQLARWYARLALELAQRRRFDVLHGFIAGPPGFLAGALGRAFGVPSVVTLMGGELTGIEDIGYGSQRHLRGRILVDRTLKSCDRITVATEFMASRVRAHGLKSTVVPMGIDVRGPADLSAARAPGPWRLLHVAALCPVKDQTTLLRAVRQLRDRGLDVEIDLIGEDSMGGAMQRLAGELGLQGVVRFRDWVPNDQLERHYAEADLLVLPSRDDAAPVVVLEAASRGLATVGSDVGYVADWAPDRATSVPTARPDHLAAAIEGLLNDAPTRIRQGRAARAWVEAHDVQWTVSAFCDVYHALVRPP